MKDMDLSTTDIKRQAWIDFLKGIGIILVVLGHVIDGAVKTSLFPDNNDILMKIFQGIYVFHMPLFFFLSGCTFYIAYYDIDKNVIKHQRVVKQVKNLFIVYCCFSIVLWVFKYISSGYVVDKVSINDLILIVIKPISAYWYLYVLILFYLSFTLIMPQINTLCGYVLIGCVVALIISATVDFNYIVFRKYFYNVIFFYLGILYENFSVKFRTTSFVIGFYFVLLFLMLILWCVLGVNTFQNIENPIVAILIIFTLLNASHKIGNVFLVSYLGRQSLVIYLLHVFMLGLYKSIVVRLIPDISCVEYILLGTLLGTSIPLFINKFLGIFGIDKYLFKPIVIFEGKTK